MTKIHSIQRETGTFFRLTNDDTFERHPCWSPDGKLIAFIDQQKDSEHESISIVSSEGGTPEILISKKDVVKVAISFTPDGKNRLFSNDRKIKTVTTDGNNKVTTLVDDIEFADRSELVFCGQSGGEPEFWLISDFLPANKK